MLHEESIESEAAKFYLAAAEQNHSAAQYRLGNLYRENARGPDDFEEAWFWLRVSADLDDRANRDLKEMVRYQQEDGEFLIDRFQIKRAKLRYYAWLKKQYPNIVRNLRIK